MGGAKSTIKVSGRELSVSNPDKVLYPATGTTKADVLEYYVTIAPWLIPHSSFRPATRKRWVDGVGSSAHPGSAFLGYPSMPMSCSIVRADFATATHSVRPAPSPGSRSRIRRSGLRRPPRGPQRH